MVRVRGVRATDEEYEEWLGRLEEEEALPTDWSEFQSVLRGELTWTGGQRLDYNDTQIAALWEFKGGQPPYAEFGVKQVIVHYPWGTELRYGIQGMPGLWGWETAREVMVESGWGG